MQDRWRICILIQVIVLGPVPPVLMDDMGIVQCVMMLECVLTMDVAILVWLLMKEKGLMVLTYVVQNVDMYALRSMRITTR